MNTSSYSHRPQMAVMDGGTAGLVAETFRALGDPTRLRIVACLSEAERTVTELAAAVGASQSAVSHQLALLRAQRVVRRRRVGHNVFYALDDRHVQQLFALALEHALHTAPGRES
jgi:DNA-binding transcriptional ArsR family regulator